MPNENDQTTTNGPVQQTPNQTTPNQTVQRTPNQTTTDGSVQQTSNQMASDQTNPSVDESINQTESMTKEEKEWWQSKLSQTTKNVTDDDMFDILDGQLAGIFGLPYQFSEIVDMPLTMEKKTTTTNKDGKEETVSTIKEGHIGRKYTEKIIGVAPVLFLSPGEPEFMEGFSATRMQMMASALATKMADIGGDDDASLKDILTTNGRYYTFKNNFNEYRKYVNLAIRSLANIMNIGSLTVPVPGSNVAMYLENFDIMLMLNKKFQKLFGTQTVIPFYVDAVTSISESFSNNTTESMISQQVNQFSRGARELRFLIGSSNSHSLARVARDVVEGLASVGGWAIGNAAAAVGYTNNLIDKVTGELGTTVAGGKLIFPEIWQDSQFSRNYSLEVKLRSPDPDPISIFLNIYVPLMLLICMAAPRQYNVGANSYISPFIVRATYKSVFNCDLGIIESLSITKGADNCWNAQGQPTSIDVSISLKDLYSYMFISKKFGLLVNTAQIDYLAMLAGVDYQEPETDRTNKLFFQIMGDTMIDAQTSLFGELAARANNLVNKVKYALGFRNWDVRR